MCGCKLRTYVDVCAIVCIRGWHVYAMCVCVYAFVTLCDVGVCACISVCLWVHACMHACMDGCV